MHARIAALVAAALLVAPAARAQTTLSFDDVSTTAASGWSAPLDPVDGFEFFNFRILNEAEPFGTGDNASSGSQFAYGGFGASAIYRTDVNLFHLSAAYLSFRSTDGDTAPLELLVTGYRGGPDPVFSRTLTLTSSAQRFELDIVNVDELVFDLVDDGRFAVLAVDDVTLAAVPEPGTVVLMASGLVLVAGVARRRVGGAR